MIARIVLGAGFGDEGKGLVTSYLASKANNPIVVRFNGGHQAGHTVEHEGKRHVFSNFGAATLQGVPTYWTKYCTVYPTAFRREYEALRHLGAVPKVFFDPLCPVTTPMDKWVNQIRAKTTGHGSCGVGFGTTIERHEQLYKLYLQDLLFPDVFEQKFNKIVDISSSIYWPVTSRKLIDEFYDDVVWMRKAGMLDFNINLYNYTDVIFEGAQGILLDQDHGFFPNVTRSHTTSRNALEILSRTRITTAEIYYVTRSYQTRHGNGYMSNEDKPIELSEEVKAAETNQTNDFQGKFRTGILDADLLKYAIMCDNNYSRYCKKHLIITCLNHTTAKFKATVDGEVVDMTPEKLAEYVGIPISNVLFSNGSNARNVQSLDKVALNPWL